MSEPYPTPRGVEDAIKDAAKNAVKAAPSLDVTRRIQLEYFNRFLSRVFSEGEGSEWLLKGGTSMLARVPSSRATQDIDLARCGFTLKQALDDLIRLSEIDLNDHFSFEFASHSESVGTDNQPYTEGYAVKFNIYIGGAAKGVLKVDLVVGSTVTGEVTTRKPASSLGLPRLISNPYRLYPVVDQIADKVCATMTEYHDKASSREKDLVDLVVFATTQDIEGTSLRIGITTETRRRKMEPFDHFTVPSTWGAGYAKLSKSVPYCAEYANVHLAAELVSRLIDPALTCEAHGKTWGHEALGWE